MNKCTGSERQLRSPGSSSPNHAEPHKLRSLLSCLSADRSQFAGSSSYVLTAKRGQSKNEHLYDRAPILLNHSELIRAAQRTQSGKQNRTQESNKHEHSWNNKVKTINCEPQGTYRTKVGRSNQATNLLDPSLPPRTWHQF